MPLFVGWSYLLSVLLSENYGLKLRSLDRSLFQTMTLSICEAWVGNTLRINTFGQYYEWLQKLGC